MSVLSAPAAPALGARDAYRIFYPAVSPPTRTPADKGLPLRRLRVVTSVDALALDGWIVPGRGPHTVIVCHGMSRTKASVLDHVRVLHEAGHHVVAYDLRNHGASGRVRRFGGMAERFTSDLRDVVRHVRDDAELGRGGIALLAFSFSTWPALHLLRDPSVQIAAVACDSGPIYDIRAGFRHFCALRRERMPRALPAGSVFSLYRFAFERCAAGILDVEGWPPDLRGVPTRLLFVAGGRDEIVPPASVLAVARHYRAGHWTAPHAIHLNALRMDREEYVRRLTRFLSAAFAAAEAPALEVAHG